MDGAPAPESSSLPEAARIREIAEEVIHRPDYELEPVVYDFSWLEEIVRSLGRILRPVGDAFSALSGISPVLAWTITILLTLILIALVAHIVYTFRVALRARRPSAATLTNAAETGDAPEAWERRARKAAAGGDYIGALRALLRASLVRLEATRSRRMQRAATNREYVRRFARTPAVEPLRLLVELIDWKWYGQGVCTESDYQAGEAAHQQLRDVAARLAQEKARAQRT